MIPARGGSKALPGKNIAPLGGKPLIVWTIDAAKASRVISRTLVTTDDSEIAEVARRHGAEVPFMRPSELAADTTPGNAPLFHALHWLEQHDGYRPSLVVLLQPTSPLRTGADIDAAIDLFADPEIDAVVGVTAAEHHPYWIKTVDANGRMRSFIEQQERIATRQELPPAYRINGAIYAARMTTLETAGDWYTPRTAAYIMPFERSIDIDTAWDLTCAGLLLRARD